MEAPKPLTVMETVSSPLSRVLSCVEELITALVCLDLAFWKEGRRKRGREEARDRFMLSSPSFSPSVQSSDKHT